MEPQVHALTGAYVCDALDPDEERDFELHLAQCPDCTTEVAELRETAAVLAMDTIQAPPTRMHAAVRARIDLTRQLPPLTAAAEENQPSSNVVPIGRARGRRGRLSRSALAGWAVAAVLAGVVGGLSVHSAVQDRQISQANAQAAQISALLSASDVHAGVAKVSGGGSVTVIDSKERDQAAITLSGLAALPSGKAYQLWIIGTGSVRSAGVVTAAEAETGKEILTDDLGNAASVAITVEPARGSAQPTTTPVLLMSLPT
jgi:anti-sigma factor RsiW